AVDDFIAVWQAANALVAQRWSVVLQMSEWVVGGKSYGGRVATLAVAAGAAARGLLLYGYPLHPPGKPERLRVDHWSSVSVPSLFLHGSRDPFGAADVLSQQLPLLAGPAELHVVVGGDHSLRIAAKHHPDGVASSEEQVIAGMAPAIGHWLTTLV
ncbi:MAG: alpha/beta family hydrolase, partial [Nitriliruptoraceae bacterium]